MDEPAGLSQGHEVGRREQPLLTVLPAHQRLHAEDPVGRDVEQRLVVQDQVAVLHGGAQLGQQGEPARVVVVEVLGVGRDALVAGLRPVHRHVGVLHQQLTPLAVAGGDGDPGADLHDQGQVVDDERVADGLDDPLRHRPAGVGRARAALGAGDEQRELVPTEAGGQLARAEHRGDARTDLAQDLVAAVVPERVVDLLEPVEVEQHDADAAPTGRRGEQLRLELAGEGGAVGEAGERVVVRLVRLPDGGLLELSGEQLGVRQRAGLRPEHHQQVGDGVGRGEVRQPQAEARQVVHAGDPRRAEQEQAVTGGQQLAAQDQRAVDRRHEDQSRRQGTRGPPSASRSRHPQVLGDGGADAQRRAGQRQRPADAGHAAVPVDDEVEGEGLGQDAFEQVGRQAGGGHATPRLWTTRNSSWSCPSAATSTCVADAVSPSSSPSPSTMPMTMGARPCRSL